MARRGAPEPDAPPQQPHPASRWSAGNSWVAKIATLCLWLLLLTGPLALVVALFGTQQAQSSTATAQAGQDRTNDQAVASELATNVVRGWLTYTKGDEDKLKGLLIDGVTVDLSETPFPAEDFSIAAARFENNSWAIVVGANMTYLNDKDKKSTKVRRYYQVPVVVDSTRNSAVAVALPHEVAFPGTAVAVQTNYSNQGEVSGSLGNNLANFFRSYLEGAPSQQKQSQLELYLAPNAQIVPVPQYDKAELKSLALTVPEKDIEVNQSIRVLAGVQVSVGKTNSLLMNFPLTVRLKNDKKWEIVDMNSNPTVNIARPGNPT